MTSSCCGSNCSCGQEARANQVEIQYLYLDLNSCQRCQGTEGILEEAVLDVANLLSAAGQKVILSKIHMDTAEIAETHRFYSSPTIRVNGQDIALGLSESQCSDCGDLCGDQVDCRTWIFEGEEYDVPPKPLLVQRILKTVYGGACCGTQEQPYTMPDNLIRFYAGKERTR